MTWQEWLTLLVLWIMPHAVFIFADWFGTPWPEKPAAVIPFSVNGVQGEIEHEPWENDCLTWNSNQPPL